MASMFRIRPERVYRQAIVRLVNNDDVVRVLGPVWRNPLNKLDLGIIRAYRLDGGGVRMGDGSRGQKLLPMSLRSGPNEQNAEDEGVLWKGSKDNKLVWRYPRVQMIFQVAGAKQQGVVTIEAIKKWRNIHFNLITVDPLDPQTGELKDENMIIVTGDDPRRLYVRDQMQELVFLRKNLMDSNEEQDVSKLPYRS